MTEFVSFARSLGLRIDYASPDGRIHRCRTDAKPGRTNGAFRFFGHWGWVQDWTVHESPVIWSDGKPGTEERRQADQAEMRRMEAAERKHAAMQAGKVVARSKFDSHRYLAAKGFHAEQALVDTDGRLVIPMWSQAGQGPVASVQWIDEAGEKKFMPGGQAKGTAHVLGARHGVTWYVEGYATGLSVLAALKSLYMPGKVVVCFFASNLAGIANDGFVFADHDDNAQRAGQAAAEKTGRPWVMSPVPGEDANDMHQRAGVRPVAELMRSVM